MRRDEPECWLTLPRTFDGKSPGMPGGQLRYRVEPRALELSDDTNSWWYRDGYSRSIEQRADDLQSGDRAYTRRKIAGMENGELSDTQGPNPRKRVA